MPPECTLAIFLGGGKRPRIPSPKDHVGSKPVPGIELLRKVFVETTFVRVRSAAGVEDAADRVDHLRM